MSGTLCTATKEAERATGPKLIFSRQLKRKNCRDVCDGLADPVLHQRRQNQSSKIHWSNFGLCLRFIPLLFYAVVLLTTDWRNAPLFVYVCFGLLLSLSFFSIVAVAIKRLHDRDKVGWWAVPFVILPGLLSSAASDLVIRSLAPYFMHALACYCCGALSSWPVYVAHLVRTSLGPILCNLDQC